MTIFLSGLVVFISRTLEAITGFGGTVLALPFVTLLLGMQEGIMLLTIMSWLFSLYVVITKFRYVDFKQFLIIGFFILLGLPVGMYLFRIADVSLLKKLLALIITISAACQLKKIVSKQDKASNTEKSEKVSVLYYGLLFVAGVVHGLFSCGGTLAVYYVAKTIKDKGSFRATLCMLWLSLNSILIAGYILDPALHEPLTQTIITSAWMIPFLILGVIVGEITHKKLQAKLFDILVFTVLFFIGIFMLVF